MEVNVVDPLIRRGYRFAGTAVVHRDGPTFDAGVDFYEERGTAQARTRIRAVVVIAVASTRPLRSPAYALGATEEELKSKYRSLLLDDEESGERDQVGGETICPAPSDQIGDID